ncbi:MAG TPA: hypothetical protein VG961_01010 [Ignavibacteria bacterium]|nr:hypothetical protein [Ignavibacteria bacterium]
MKTIIAGILLLIAVNVTFSDQLAWITEEQAMQTVDYLKENKVKYVILWCACCDNDTKMKIKITRVFYKAAEGQTSYFEVWIEGKDKDGKKLKQAVDLAYVHIKKAGEWNCLGTVMGFQCDPCTKPFKF